MMDMVDQSPQLFYANGLFLLQDDIWQNSQWYWLRGYDLRLYIEVLTSRETMGGGSFNTFILHTSTPGKA